MDIRKYGTVAFYAVAAAVLLIGTFNLVGCEGSGAEAKQRLQTEAEGLDRELESLEPTIDELTAEVQAARELGDSEILEDAEAALRVAKEKHTEISAKVANLRAKIDAIDEEGGALAVNLEAIGELGKEVGPMLPPPFNTIIAVGGVALAGVARALGKREKTKREKAEEHLTKTVFAIDAGKSGSPLLAAGLAERRDVIRLAMGPDTAEVVDHIRDRTIDPVAKAAKAAARVSAATAPTN